VQIVFRPEAAHEVLQAQAWYEARVHGLGLTFAKAVDVALERAQRRPLAFRVIEPPYRQVILSRFPYSIIYKVSEAELVIVACFHHRKHPKNWGRT
jgi:toxin ParE1/3/4